MPASRADSWGAFLPEKVVIVSGTTYILQAIGYPEAAVVSLLYLMLADWALGTWRALWEDALSGAGLWKGIQKILRYGLSIILIIWVDETLHKVWDDLPKLRDWFIAFLALIEFLSCAEHLAYFGMPFPRGVISKLKNYRTKLEKEIEDDSDNSGDNPTL